MVVALAAEISTILPGGSRAGEPIRIDAQTQTILTGMGAGRAEAGARRLLEAGADALLSWGTAAALVDGLPPGALLVPELLIGTDGARTLPDLQWSESLRETLAAVGGALADPGGVLDTEQGKRELGKRTGAVAADMESASVARVARESRVPFAAIRAISDAPTTPVPSRVLAAVDPLGRLPARAVLTEVLLSPTGWPGLIRIGWGFARGRSALKRAWRTLDDSARVL